MPDEPENTPAAAITRALDALDAHAPSTLVEEARAVIMHALDVRRITPLQLQALEEAHYRVTVEPPALPMALRTALWELITRGRQENSAG